MRLIDFLLQKAPADDTPPPAWPSSMPLSDAVQARIDAAALESEPHDIHDDEEPLRLRLEPVYIIIDYRDANGIASRRRITMRTLVAGPNGPVLRATCHERRAPRAFRCDRIECFIDQDGEVFECARFFQEVLDIDLLRFTATDEPDDATPRADTALTTARAIRDYLRPELALLIAAAMADDDYHIEELDRIQQYAERRAHQLAADNRFGGTITLETCQRLCDVVARMRPTRQDLEDHLRAMTQRRSDAVDEGLFRRTLYEVLLADGRYLDSEDDFLADFDAMARGTG